MAEEQENLPFFEADDQLVIPFAELSSPAELANYVIGALDSYEQGRGGAEYIVRAVHELRELKLSSDQKFVTLQCMSDMGMPIDMRAVKRHRLLAKRSESLLENLVRDIPGNENPTSMAVMREVIKAKRQERERKTSLIQQRLRKAPFVARYIESPKSSHNDH